MPKITREGDSLVKVNNIKNASWGYPSFLTFVGAAIYFISQTDGGFWVVILALLKAAVWPAFVIFHALQLLGA